MKRAAGRAMRGTGGMREAITAALPYALTGAQQSAMTEILADMAKPERMLRLLQGDVGSGKTVVALLALAAAVESGAQGAFMVPTEILARQHMATLGALIARRRASMWRCSPAGKKARRATMCCGGWPMATSTFWSARTRCFRMRWHSRTWGLW